MDVCSTFLKLKGNHNQLNRFFNFSKLKNINKFFHLLKKHQLENYQILCQQSVNTKARKILYIELGAKLVNRYLNIKKDMRFQSGSQAYTDKDGSNQRNFLMSISQILYYLKGGNSKKSKDDFDSD